MHTDQLIAVAAPKDVAEAKKAGFRVMCPGWIARTGAVSGPALPLACDVLCVSGHWEGDFAPLARGLAAEGRSCAAQSMFLDFHMPPEAWAALETHIPSYFKLFAPWQHLPQTGRITGVLPIPAEEAVFQEAVSRLPAAQNAAGRGAFLPLVRRKTRIDRNGTAEVLPLSGQELAAVLAANKPTLYRSLGQMAEYFTLSQEGQTFYYLFDSKASVAEKLAFLSRQGFGKVFVHWADLALL